MQDIVFYVAANETLGMIRDYANERNSPAPVLTLGVSVCLRMRLFSSTEGATPYPVTALNGISDWLWSMDSDFDRDTACKLVADAAGISVHTETDTVNGQTMSFTEFVIPITNMNTEELAAWLGNEKMKSGLTGELVGYDSSGNAVFVLQIENFSVRNRVAGLGDPTVLDQEIVTRTQAEHMIQTAVSTSAATKQDKLTSSNAGVGISITSSGIISTADIPQNAIPGLPETLAAKQNIITAGYRMTLVSGSTVEQARYFAIEPAITASANNTTTVVLSAGKAYEIHAVANNAKVLLNRENPPNSRTFGLEGHAEIFVANTGYVQTGTNVVLANALEPDAVNNCTVRFHDGLAIISVEDHVAGYIVVSATGSTAGTLPYALSSASQEYVAFDATLNGQTLDLGGATTNGEKHIVGNGYAETVISGGINCTSKTTVANLGMNGVIVSSGTLTLGDVYIPSGATVAVSGGGLAIEKVSGNGGTIELNRTAVMVGSGDNAFASGVIFESGGLVSTGTGAFYVASNGSLTLVDCTISGGSANTGAAMNINKTSNVFLSGCSIIDNTATAGYTIVIANGGMEVSDCTFGGLQNIIFNNSAGSDTVTLKGHNYLSNAIIARTSAMIGNVTISSGAVVDLTGNTNNPAINPRGGVTFAPGGATVYPSAGSASAYILGGMTVSTIGNTNVLNLGGSYIAVGSGVVALASDCVFSGGNSPSGAGGNMIVSSGGRFVANSCTFTGGSAAIAGGFDCNTSASATLTNCTISGNSATTAGGGFATTAGGVVVLNECVISGNLCADTLAGKDVWVNIPVTINGGTYGDCAVQGSGNIEISGDVKLDKVYTRNGQTGGTVTISSGAIINLTGSINPGNGVTFEQGGATIVPGGSSAIAYTLGGMTVPQLGNTNVVNLGGTRNMISSGVSAYASGCTFTSGGIAGENGGGAYVNSGASLFLDNCVVSGNSGYQGKGVYIAGGKATVSNTDFGTDQDICFRFGTGELEIGGNCSIFRVSKNANANDSGSVTIFSGASINLTSSINPGGGITIYGGDMDNPTTIYGSAGSATQSRGFSAECVITGSAVTKIGAISGATVSLASSSCQLEFIKSGEETVSITYMQANESPYVLETQQGAGAVLVRVSED